MNNSTLKVSFAELFPLIEEEIQKGNSFSFTANGNSMLPFLKGGQDRVTLSPVNSPVGKGDVLFYRRDGGAFVLHRVVRVLDGENFLTCGDNQFVLEKITRGQVIARLESVTRKSKNYPCASLSHRVWCVLLPLRRSFLRMRAAVGRWKRALFSRSSE